MSTERLSELEQVVLGIVWKQGPCTPHAIRTNFVTSRNSRFSGSAGAIYPLVRRMEKRGLLRSRQDMRKRQRRRLYEISEGGLARLREWLAPPYPADTFGVLHDPVRLRMYFLEALPPRKRAAFLEVTEEGYRVQIDRLHEDLERYTREGSTYSMAAIRGALAVCRAQLRWIRSIREATY